MYVKRESWAKLTSDTKRRWREVEENVLQVTTTGDNKDIRTWGTHTYNGEAKRTLVRIIHTHRSDIITFGDSDSVVVVVVVVAVDDAVVVVETVAVVLVVVVDDDDENDDADVVGWVACVGTNDDGGGDADEDDEDDVVARPFLSSSVGMTVGELAGDRWGVDTEVESSPASLPDAIDATGENEDDTEEVAS